MTIAPGSCAAWLLFRRGCRRAPESPSGQEICNETLQALHGPDRKFHAQTARVPHGVFGIDGAAPGISDRCRARGLIEGIFLHGMVLVLTLQSLGPILIPIQIQMKLD